MKELWQKFFPDIVVDEAGKGLATCPFHEPNKEPSLVIDTENDVCYCADCGYEGNYKQFQTLAFDNSESETRVFFKDGGLSTVKPCFIRLDLVEVYHEALLKSDKWMKSLKEKRLINSETVRKFKLGLDRKRIIIPVFSQDEKRVLDLRKYDPFDTKGFKIISEKGYGCTRIYPEPNFDRDAPLLFLEGEMDALLGNQLGFNAITITTGAVSRLPKKYLDLFRDREVVVCYDLDESGRLGARKRKQELFHYARHIDEIRLPDELGEGGDFTNYFQQGYTLDDFQKLLTEIIQDVTLENLVHSKNLNKRVRTIGKISGKDEIPYLVPKILKVQCKQAGEKKACVHCPYLEHRFEPKEVLIPDRDPICLELLGIPASTQRGILKGFIGVPRNCKSFIEIEIQEGRNVESLRLVPEKLMVGSGRWVVRNAYFLGRGLLPNQIYDFEGIVVPEPKLQFASFLIEKARTEANPLDTIDFDFSQLQLFHADPGEVTQKITDRAYQLQQNVTKIYGRGDLIVAINLVFFTPIGFYFQGDMVQRGWGDIMILGDSRQGKTVSAARLFDYYGFGEIVSGESASLAGLKGGVSQVGKTWHLQWGIIPLNDRGIVAIDEAQNLDKKVFSSLSRVRSEGIADIVMIKTERTVSRTRLIFIANPKTNRPLKSWPHGVEAVQQFGKLADIARFDFVLTIGDGEVSASTMRKEQAVGEIDEKYPRDLWRQLILWMWSRKPEDIIFSPEVEDYIFEVSDDLSKKFRSPIPIVKESEERFVVAKYAASVAAQVFSTDKTLQKVVVGIEHVDFVKNFLISVFTKDSCGYDDFAVMNQKLEELSSPEKVKELVMNYEGVTLAEAFLSREYLTFADFQDIFGLERKRVREIVSELVRNRALRRNPSNMLYVKTPAFISLLKDIRQEVPF